MQATGANGQLPSFAPTLECTQRDTLNYRLTIRAAATACAVTVSGARRSAVLIILSWALHQHITGVRTLEYAGLLGVEGEVGFQRIKSRGFSPPYKRDAARTAQGDQCGESELLDLPRTLGNSPAGRVIWQVGGQVFLPLLGREVVPSGGADPPGCLIDVYLP